MPSISIIVPIYNVENYLHDCVESILNQIFQDFELILVNDGSTDNSYLICQEFQKKDKRVRVINKENGGVSSARNAGLCIAKGKYIGFIDPDDTIKDNMYEKLYEAAIKTDSDITICSFNIIDLIRKQNDIAQLPYNIQNTIDRNKIEIEVIPKLLSLENGLGYGIYSPFNKLYKKSLFDQYQIKFDELRQYEEDAKLNMILLNKVQKITFIPSPLYNYYIRPRKSLTQIFRESAYEDNLENLKIHTELCIRYDCSKYIKKAIENYLNTTVQHVIEIQRSSLSFIKKKKLISKITKDDTFKRYIKTYKAPTRFLKILKILMVFRANILIMLLINILIIKERWTK